jgi:hypothetical protein
MPSSRPRSVIFAALIRSNSCFVFHASIPCAASCMCLCHDRNRAQSAECKLCASFWTEATALIVPNGACKHTEWTIHEARAALQRQLCRVWVDEVVFGRFPSLLLPQGQACCSHSHGCTSSPSMLAAAMNRQACLVHHSGPMWPHSPVDCIIFWVVTLNAGSPYSSPQCTTIGHRQACSVSQQWQSHCIIPCHIEVVPRYL